MDIKTERYIAEEKVELDLSLQYRMRLARLAGELELSNEELIEFLIDLINLPGSTEISLLKKAISKSINRGVNYSFIKSIKSLYTFLGHFLKKIKEI
jgi:hypothetical protein